MISPILMYSFFVVLYIIDVFVLSLVGHRQVTNDFTSDDNDKRGRNRNKNVNEVGVTNTNSGNQNSNFGKRQVTDDFPNDDNDKRSRNREKNVKEGGGTNDKHGRKNITCNMNKGGVGHNKNTGNQNVNFGKRQVTKDFTRGHKNNNGGDNKKSGPKEAACDMNKGSSGLFPNTGNQNVNFGKRQLTKDSTGDDNDERNQED